MTNPTQNIDLSGTGGTEPARPCKAESDKARRDSDLHLVLQAQAGDIQAFGELVSRYQRAVYGIVSRMVHDRDEVDDLVQEVFVAAYQAIGKFRRDAKFSTWLHTISVNMTLKRLGKMKKQIAVSIDDPVSGLASAIRADDGLLPAEALQEREKSEAVRKAIDSLSEKQKIVVIMRYFEQYTCDEIASILKCSVGTVWSRLHGACKKLRTELRWLEQVS